MNRTEYMNALEKRLRILPGDSYREAMGYFQEYFDEAGPEREQQAIEDLGSPENAAEQIITNMAIDKASVPQKGIRKNMSTLWIGVLAVCAVPVALPFALLLLALLVMCLLCILLMLAAFIMVAVCVAVIGPVTFAAGFTVLLSAPAAAITCFGMGLFFTGLGLLAVYGVFLACKWTIIGMVRLFSRILKKKGVRHE